MLSELRIIEEKVNDEIVVSIDGEVDIYTSQNLKEKLYNIVENNSSNIRVNCKNLNYIDSTGLGIFVGALKVARQKNKQIIFYNLRDNIKKLFLITGLDKVFVIEE